MSNDGESNGFAHDEPADEANRQDSAVAEDDDSGGEAIPPFVLPRVKEVRRLGAP